MSAFVISKIFPSMNIDANQRFIFGLEGTPEPLGSFKLDNIYIPISGSPSFTNFEHRNNDLSGYRWIHQTELGDTYGTFKLQKFLTASSTGIDLLTFNNDGTIDFPGFTADVPSLVNVTGPTQTFQFNSATSKFIIGNTTSNTVNEYQVNFGGASGGLRMGVSGDSPSNQFSYINTTGSSPLRFQSSGITKMYMNGGGDFAVGDIPFGSPAARFDIYGGTQHIFNEETMIRVNSFTDAAKIEINNLSTNGHLYELRSNSDGSFDIVDRTLAASRFKILTTGDFDINNKRITNAADPINPQDLATRGYVDSAVDSSFGPNVSLPFTQLNFNWNNLTGSDPFIFNQELTNTSPFIRQYTYRISSVTSSGIGTGTRKWDLFYDLGDPTEPYALMQFEFTHPLGAPTSIIPFKIEMIGPSWASTIYLNGVLSLNNQLHMNSNYITGVNNPLFGDHAANKDYVDTSLSSITTSLNVPKLGIGITPTVDGRIQFASTVMDNKLSLRNVSGNDYDQSGFGVNSIGGMMYHAALNTTHTFYLGNSTTIPLTIDVLGINIAQLRPIDADYRRIMLYDEGENLHQIYNIGIKTLDGTHHAIHSQVSSSQSAFTWAYGLNASSSYELMRLDNNALKINNGKLTILESASLISWNLTPISDGTFSIQSTANPTNTFRCTSTSSSSIFSVLNVNPLGVARFRANGGVSGDYVELAYDASVGYSYINLAAASNDRLAFRVNGTGVASLLQTGLFGLGTITPTLGKLEIQGGVQNVSLEETAIYVRSALNNVKIELHATAGSGRKYEIRSSNTGIFDITDRTGSRTLYTIDSNANHIFNTVGTLFAKRPRGYLYMSGNATSAASVANTWVKIAGTTVLGATSNLWDMPVNNRLRYTGTPSLLNVNVNVCLTFTYGSSVATRLGFSIFKNGVLLADSPKYVSNVTTNLSMFVSLGISTSFVTNDYIEIYFLSPNGGVNLVGTDLSVVTG